MRQPHRVAVTASLAALVALGVVAPTASLGAPGRGAAADYPRLAGLNTFTATRTSRAVVDVVRAVDIPVTPGDGHVRGLTVKGAGRIVGLALVSPDGRLGLVQLEMRTCFAVGCTSTEKGFGQLPLATTWGAPTPTGISKPPTTFRLPAGRYLLSVFTDGAPVTVTWRLPHLAGHCHLALRLAQHEQQATPAEQGQLAGSPVTPRSYAEGTGSVTTDIGVLGFAHRSDATPHAQSDVSWCIYDQSGPPGGVLAPGCPDGVTLQSNAILVKASLREMSYGMLVLGGGAAGGYYQAVDDTGVQNLASVHDNLFWADAGMPIQH